MTKVQYQYKEDNLADSEPNKFNPSELKSEEMIINLGPQHPSTHGVLRLEVISDGEVIKDVVPHIGYLHRCFEKHAENLPYNQIIPFVDRMDYVAAMNSEHAYAMGVEKMLDESNRFSFNSDWYVWFGLRCLYAILLGDARSRAYSSIAGMGEWCKTTL
jgi:NADH-quinone oxidoreductase subunit D